MQRPTREEAMNICPYCEQEIEGPVIVIKGEKLVEDLQHWRDTGEWPVGEHDFPARILRAYLAALDVIEAARNIPGVYSDAKHHQLYLALRKFKEDNDPEITKAPERPDGFGDTRFEAIGKWYACKLRSARKFDEGE